MRGVHPINCPGTIDETLLGGPAELNAQSLILKGEDSCLQKNSKNCWNAFISG